MPICAAIDHVILAVPDLDAAVATCTQLLGLHVSGGGVHPHAGTANRIIVVGDSYIELISAQPGARPHGRIGSLLAPGREGWVGFALATVDPQETADTLARRGVAVDGPAPGWLETGDQFSRGWQVVSLNEPPLPGMPFLIRHDTAGEERQRLLAGNIGLAPHPNGARTIAGITVAVDDLEIAAAAYERCFDLQATILGEDTMLAARTATAVLAIRGHAYPGRSDNPRPWPGGAGVTDAGRRAVLGDACRRGPGRRRAWLAGTRRRRARRRAQRCTGSSATQPTPGAWRAPGADSRHLIVQVLPGDCEGIVPVCGSCRCRYRSYVESRAVFQRVADQRPRLLQFASHKLQARRARLCAAHADHLLRKLDLLNELRHGVQPQ